MQTALYGKIKERKGEWLIGASTQNLTQQHKVLIIGKVGRRVLIMGKARNLTDSYSNELLKYTNCVIENMLLERFCL